MLTTKHTTLTTTGATTLFQVPSGYVANIYYIFIANHGGSTNSVILKVQDSNNTDILFLFDDVNVSGGEKETLGGQSSLPLFVFNEEEKVRCKTGSAGDVEFAITFDLVERPAAFSNFNGS